MLPPSLDQLLQNFAPRVETKFHITEDLKFVEVGEFEFRALVVLLTLKKFEKICSCSLSLTSKWDLEKIANERKLRRSKPKRLDYWQIIINIFLYISSYIHIHLVGKPNYERTD